MKLIDRIIDKIIDILTAYRTNRRLAEIRKNDPFIYH